MKPSDLYPKIESLVSSYYTSLNQLLQTLNEYLYNSCIKAALFPEISVFESSFNEILFELKSQTTKLKIQLKLCPGVEPPIVKRVQRQTFKTIKKPYTE